MLLLFLAVICVTIILGGMLYYVWQRAEGTYMLDEQRMLSENLKYIGIIDEANFQVRIVSHSGKDISCINILDTEESVPDQIALGDNSYFLLFQEENARIIQYDYQSNKIQECTIPGIATITCRNGYLFLGEWGNEGYYFYPFYNSFYAHSYIKEEEFGGSPKELKQNKNGRCIVGGVELYFHKEGFYSTEPAIGDYPGTHRDYFTLDDKEEEYQAGTKQEERNRSLLLKAVGTNEHVANLVYDVCEYQEGGLIYGVCNIHERWVPSQPIKLKNVVRSYYYRIDPDKDEITILGQTDSSIPIAASESVLVYQKGKDIIRENHKTGEKEVIYRIKSTQNLHIYLNGYYLLIVEERQKLFLNPFSREQVCYAVRWKDY